MTRQPDHVMITATRAGDKVYLELMWECEGCHDVHCIPVRGDSKGRPKWTWNGSLSKPTLSPSILKQGGNGRCHSFVRDGKVQFLKDCEHELAGQTVEMKPKLADPFGRPLP